MQTFVNLIFSKFLCECSFNLLQMIELFHVTIGFVTWLNFIILFCIMVVRYEYVKQ